MANMMKNALKALQDLGPYVLAVFGTILIAYVFTLLLGMLSDNVVPNLGLNTTGVYNNTSGYAYYDTNQILYSGADGIYNVAGITLISTGLMALAMLLSVFGMKRFERFNIGTEKLVRLMQDIGSAVSLYGILIFIMALIRILLGYLDEKITTSIGVTSSTWLTYFSNILGLMTTGVTEVVKLSDIGIALLTLGLVLAAFGFELQLKFNFGKKKKMNNNQSY